MRKTGFLLLIFFFSIISRCFALNIAVDDTLKGTRNSKFLIFPFFLRSPETKWGFGSVAAFFFKAKKNDVSIRTSDINLVTLYTLNRQAVVVLGTTVFFPEEKNIFRLQTSYSYYPDKCWGIGNETLKSEEESYSIKQFYFNPQFLQKIYRSWYFGVSYDFQNIHDFKYDANGIFDQQHITGRYGGSVSGAGMLFTWDTRNNAYSPSKGFFAELSATAYGQRLGSDFSFNSYSLDLRKFINLSEKNKRVLAMQLLVKDNTGTVPLRNLALLGGPEIMRGYYKGRFVDKDLIAYQAELRQFLFWRLGVTAFGSVGEVSSAIPEFNLKGLHYACGAGVRIMVSKSEKLNLRVDYGIGKNSNGLYVILKEAF